MVDLFCHRFAILFDVILKSKQNKVIINTRENYKPGLASSIGRGPAIQSSDPSLIQQADGDLFCAKIYNSSKCSTLISLKYSLTQKKNDAIYWNKKEADFTLLVE